MYVTNEESKSSVGVVIGDSIKNRKSTAKWYKEKMNP